MDIQILAETLIIRFGYMGSFILVLLEYANFPIPSEVVLPLIGLFSSEYNLNLFLMIALSTLAGIIGSLINYYIGFRYGRNILNIISEKFAFLKKPLESADFYISQYGKSAVLITRVIPLARTAISLIAGIYKIPLSVFIVYSSIGISVWNIILIMLGYFLKNNFDFIGIILSKYSITCITILVIIILIVSIMKITKNITNE